MHRRALILLMSLLVACGGAPAPKYAAFNGTWRSDVLAFSIDLDKKTYTNARAGLTDVPIEIVSEQGNAVTVTLTDTSLGTKVWTLRAQEDGRLSFQGEGRPRPVLLKRQTMSRDFPLMLGWTVMGLIGTVWFRRKGYLKAEGGAARASITLFGRYLLPPLGGPVTLLAALLLPRKERPPA